MCADHRDRFYKALDQAVRENRWETPSFMCAWMQVDAKSREDLDADVGLIKLDQMDDVVDALENIAVAALALDEIGKVILTELEDNTGVIENCLNIQQQIALRFWSGGGLMESDAALDAIQAIVETALEVGVATGGASRENLKYAQNLLRHMRELICDRIR